MEDAKLVAGLLSGSTVDLGSCCRHDGLLHVAQVALNGGFLGRKGTGRVLQGHGSLEVRLRLLHAAVLGQHHPLVVGSHHQPLQIRTEGLLWGGQLVVEGGPVGGQEVGCLPEEHQLLCLTGGQLHKLSQRPVQQSGCALAHRTAGWGLRDLLHEFLKKHLQGRDSESVLAAANICAHAYRTVQRQGAGGHSREAHCPAQHHCQADGVGALLASLQSEGKVVQPGFLGTPMAGRCCNPASCSLSQLLLLCCVFFPDAEQVPCDGQRPVSDCCGRLRSAHTATGGSSRTGLLLLEAIKGLQG
mmetsp:Transcript_16292/g.45385  ORF Transcript_16292/g.45385 Transcript_16292/m.45385 type:complete len:301 (-) Transcript_16292:2177-3079(-)